MKHPIFILALLLGVTVIQGCGEQAEAPSVAAQKAGAASVTQAGRTVAETTWEELIPGDWDPQAVFQGVDIASFDDNDPKALDLMLKLRQAWDNAPMNTALNGREIRIPGYVVPLDQQADGIREFLLVPYFGACIHTPPPPANQIIHVLMEKPMDLHAMSTVWVSGKMEVMRSETEMGKAGYRVQQAQVKAYEG